VVGAVVLGTIQRRTNRPGRRPPWLYSGRPVSDDEGPGTITSGSLAGTRSTPVAIIGAGRVGTALGVRLDRAGYRVVAATGRDATRARLQRYLPFVQYLPPESAAQAAKAGDVVIIGVIDDLIAPTCVAVAEAEGFRSGQHVLHLSGSVSLDALTPAGSAGAEVLSLHPLQSFPDVDEGIARLPGSGVAVTARTEEGAAFGEALARDAGGTPFRLPDEVKPLYHAAAVFASNYLVTVEGMADHLFRLSGLEEPLRLYAPLVRTAFERTMAMCPQAALTGPAVRGDVGTIARNLEALSKHAPEAVPAYVALARVAAEIALRAGRLTGPDHERLDEELGRWR
jgi:predicted short-subunit dehydrogenase-like oxidoreductase (DUF2520 family)